jgi:carbon starvation protein
MNALLVGSICLVILGIGYKYYGKIIEKLWEVSSERKTPAIVYQDSIDYIPARHWSILFGHHFASIAGAAPIIGPVIAVALWGWVPALLWIVFGTILFGAVHDFSALMASLRHKGKSIADVTETVISYRAKILFAIFLWLALILVIAVFAAVAAKTLASTPAVVIPTFGLIFVAFLTGLMLYRWKIHQVIASIIGVSLLFGLIILGYYFPIDIGENAQKIWTIVLLCYAFIAAILPVNLLLQPRDYLATAVLFIGLISGYIGLLITHPQMHTPEFITWKTEDGMLLWPMMFVTVACGAISGFHSLIASGTTSKQLKNEQDARKIGYGGMIMEGMLAVLALLCVSGGLYWSVEEGGKLGLIYPELLKEKGWIGAFGHGYGELVKPMFGTFSMLVGITMLKTFVMTTLDSATRIGRYIGEELFGEGLKMKIWKNRYISTGIIIIFAAWLALSNWKAIWPIFGASNQLVAALALIVATVYLARIKKPTAYTFYPAIFMLITTIGALIYKINCFLSNKEYMLATVGGILLILAIVMIIESILALKRLGNISSNDVGASNEIRKTK